MSATHTCARARRPASPVLFAALALAFVVAGCDDTGSVDPEPPGAVPIEESLIDTLLVPRFWVLDSGEFRSLRLDVELSGSTREAVLDGELVPPAVTVEIMDTVDADTVASFVLHDDGGAVPIDDAPGFVAETSGDLVPGDFSYSARIHSGFTDAEGPYTFAFFVEGLHPPDSTMPMLAPALLVKIEVTVSANEPPVISGAQLPDSLHSGFDTQQWTVEVSDPNESSGDRVRQVTVALAAGGVTYRDFLFAAGEPPSWNFTADSTFAAGLATDDYTMTFTATDEFEQSSDPFEAAVWIENLAPALSNLTAPDTVEQPGPDDPANVYAFTVAVADGQGQGDIERVYYTVLDPNGNFTESDEFVFRDDGEDVDETAGDGVWSHAFQVDAGVSNFGTYTFTFYADDHAGNTSAPTEKEIYQRAHAGGNE